MTVAEKTLSSMHDARDAEDRRLLDEKNHKQLLAGYFHLVRERCFLRLRKEDAADDAVQQVFERLLKELRAGKTYPVPYRIVVALVTDWTLRGFYPQPKQDSPLPDELDTAAPQIAHARHVTDGNDRCRTRTRRDCDARRRMAAGEMCLLA